MVMSQCDENKSLGFDMFNFAFYKRIWYLLRTNLGIMFEEFHRFASLPRSFSSFFCGSCS